MGWISPEQKAKAQKDHASDPYYFKRKRGSYRDPDPTTEYAHPLTGEPRNRLTKEEYDVVPESHRKYPHKGAEPYGEGADMKYHGEGKPYGGR